ncbi:hypothetical protein Ga0061063_2706 [Gulbenkiania indica]|uniref:Uncharacterized protein n=1 Tax=Gulbenkiania indica TaxID=375574 RepID=A0A0K6H6I7_9NEIS|nr:hypothetical protein [Gulbenkiania indica]CUA86523.1 hypothetical protein Ga0061063_2706 [Gulbenkiania indica]
MSSVMTAGWAGSFFGSASSPEGATPLQLAAGQALARHAAGLPVPGDLATLQQKEALWLKAVENRERQNRLQASARSERTRRLAEPAALLEDEEAPFSEGEASAAPAAAASLSPAASLLSAGLARAALMTQPVTSRAQSLRLALPEDAAPRVDFYA